MKNQRATQSRMRQPPSNRGPRMGFPHGSPRGLPRAPPLTMAEQNRLRSLVAQHQQQQLQQRQPGPHHRLPRHDYRPQAPARGYHFRPGMQQFPHGARGPVRPLAFPPAQFPGAASLVSQLDKKVLVWLWEGRREEGHKLVGYFRSFDRYANFILQNTFRRKYHGKYFCEVPLGLYIVRGDSVLLIGELNLREDKEQKKQFQVSEAVLKRLQAGESMESIRGKKSQRKSQNQSEGAAAPALSPD